MASPPTLHLLNRNNYDRHQLLVLPEEPLPDLGSSSIRLQTKILGLTTNNLTYARMGHVLGYYDIFPLPLNTPPPYNDNTSYGRIAAWGYAEIISSTIPSIPVGHTVYGILPISNIPEDITIEVTDIPNQLLVTNSHRQHLWKVYNRYELCAPLSTLQKSPGLDFLGWDSLMQGLFATSYNLNRYGFSWTDEDRIYPSGTSTTSNKMNTSGSSAWTASDADLNSATVVILSASGKTAVSFAHQLRHNRPVEYQPKTILGVCSSASKSLVDSTGLYDKIATYDDHEQIKKEISAQSPHRTVLLDFGAREGARETWNKTLSTLPAPHTYTFVLVGGEVKAQSPEEAKASLKSFSAGIVVNASELREKGIENGGEAYFKDFYDSFNGFKKDGGIPGAELVWSEGLEGWEKGWEAFCRDEVPAGKGLVYRL